MTANLQRLPSPHSSSPGSEDEDYDLEPLVVEDQCGGDMASQTMDDLRREIERLKKEKDFYRKKMEFTEERMEHVEERMGAAISRMRREWDKERNQLRKERDFWEHRYKESLQDINVRDD